MYQNLFDIRHEISYNYFFTFLYVKDIYMKCTPLRILQINNAIEPSCKSMGSVLTSCSRSPDLPLGQICA